MAVVTAAALALVVVVALVNG
ncbi:MAG: hypothetical protein QOE23_1339, partial [Pseudonocardiales bacterium]|nr:hypothetical protein [Pseudonocardiales bacterium]